MIIYRGRAAGQAWLISHDWERYRKFLTLLDGKLVEAVQEWEQAIDQGAEEIEDKESLNEYYDVWAGDNFVMQQHKIILLNSFFSTSFALFEHHLTWLCNELQQRSGSAFSVKDLKNSFTERVKTYFRKLNFAFPSDSREWNEITFYQEIRNKIMHEGGFVSSNWEGLDNAQMRGIVNSGDDGLQVELTFDFCQKATKDFEQFLKKVVRSRKREENKTSS